MPRYDCTLSSGIYAMFLPLIAIAWLYVALMMAVAEATSPVGSVLGAVFTFLLYGAGPVALLLYILGTPMRKKLRRLREAQDMQGEEPPPAQPPHPIQQNSGDPDAGGHASADLVAPMRKEP